MRRLTAKEYEQTVLINPNSIFFKYTNREDAHSSYASKFANPRFNSDELFVYEVIGLGYVVQTTGSLVKASV